MNHEEIDTELADSPFESDCPYPDNLPKQPTHREDPMAFAIALAPMRHGAGAIPWLVGVADHRRAIHPFDGLCKACLVKEPPQETKLDQTWRTIDSEFATGWFPVNCCEACYDDAKSDKETLAKQREWWESKCPIEFRKDWDNRKGDPRMLAKVLAFNPDLNRGMIIHGETDSAKTRAVWQLAKQLAMSGREWMIVESIDLLDNIPERAFSVEILIIDDLGNDQLTQAKEVRLLKLIRSRCNWHKPIIITTQFVGDSLMKRFTETATARAIIRRLRDFCESVNAKPYFGN